MGLRLLISLLLAAAPAPEGDSLRVMFWNLENFFDWRDGGTGAADAEFSSRGERHWTRKKFSAKNNAIAKGILWSAGPDGALPDIIGVAEVENAFVLRQLCRESPLRKYGYGYVHYDSPDRRGIDVGLLYRKETIRVVESKPLRVDAVGPGGDTLHTRDILLVIMETRQGDKLAMFVNHHPSKYGGGDSDWRRNAAVERLAAACDSLKTVGVMNIIATGDFNDTPEKAVYRRLGEAGLANLALPLAQRGLGTIRYDGRWELIDMCFVSPSLAETEMEIIEIPFLTTHDNANGGEKPLRTYTGPRHVGGVSDHRPVRLCLPLANFR